jgi:hypothetical protein
VDEVNAKNTPAFSKITLEETRAAHARAAGVIISLTMVAQHESSGTLSLPGFFGAATCGRVSQVINPAGRFSGSL